MPSLSPHVPESDADGPCYCPPTLPIYVAPRSFDVLKQSGGLHVWPLAAGPGLACRLLEMLNDPVQP